MPRVKQIALSDPPSQEPLEGGSDSALPFTSNTVASSITSICPTCADGEQEKLEGYRRDYEQIRQRDL
jgi:hypothetical protein